MSQQLHVKLYTESAVCSSNVDLWSSTPISWSTKYLRLTG